jgi:hypothetical protein
VQGAALGGLMGTLAPDGGAALPVPPPPPGADPKVLASFKQAQVLTGPVHMRNHFEVNITTSTKFALM